MGFARGTYKGEDGAFVWKEGEGYERLPLKNNHALLKPCPEAPEHFVYAQYNDPLHVFGPNYSHKWILYPRSEWEITEFIREESE